MRIRARRRSSSVDSALSGMLSGFLGRLLSVTPVPYELPAGLLRLRFLGGGAVGGPATGALPAMDGSRLTSTGVPGAGATSSPSSSTSSDLRARLPRAPVAGFRPLSIAAATISDLRSMLGGCLTANALAAAFCTLVSALR